MVGAVPRPPPRRRRPRTPLDGYFAMARGTQDAAPLEMTKWFDTNYHYLVPELGPDTVFTADSTKQVAELARGASRWATPPARCSSARSPTCCSPSRRPASPAGLRSAHPARPAAAGLRRGARRPARGRRRMGAAGRTRARPGPHPGRTERRRPRLPRPRCPHRPAETAGRLLLRPARRRAAGARQGTGRGPGPRLHRTGRRQPRTTSPRSAGCPANGWSPAWSTAATSGSTTWPRSLSILGTLLGLADRVDVAASCSLLHVPLDAADWSTTSTRRSPAGWPSPGQKTAEITTLARGLTHGTGAIAAELAANRADLASRATSALTHDPAVRARTAAVTDADARRPQPYPERAAAQRDPAAACRCCRRPPSARSRRPPNCAPPGPTCGPDGSTRPRTRSASRRRSARSSPSRRRPASTSWCTASPNATTWCSTSPSSSPATWPPGTAGSSPTAPATSGRRSWPATSRAPSR